MWQETRQNQSTGETREGHLTGVLQEKRDNEAFTPRLTQDFQNMQLGAGYLLNCPRCMQSWNVMRLVQGEGLCDCTAVLNPGAVRRNRCCDNGGFNVMNM